MGEEVVVKFQSDYDRMAQFVDLIVHIDGVTGSSPNATTTRKPLNNKVFSFSL